MNARAPSSAALALAAPLALAALGATRAGAHDFNPGVLALHERADGAYAIAWTEPVDSRGAAAGVRVVFPDGCARDASAALLRCDGALAGTMAFSGLHDPAMQVIVSVHRADGDIDEHIVTGAAPTVVLGAHAPSRSLALWVRLGVEHILGGLDHLAFVLGLLLVLELRVDRRLVATLTAFTLAHSVTLALAALDVVRLPSAPVEASIALSVLLVAREGLRPRSTALRRAPWLVAGVFGLVHGLGFAGALAELGLPRDSLASSLALFNVGVELGQLAVVAAAVVLVRAAALLLRGRDTARLAHLARTAACTAMGALAAYWLIVRVTS